MSPFRLLVIAIHANFYVPWVRSLSEYRKRFIFSADNSRKKCIIVIIIILISHSQYYDMHLHRVIKVISYLQEKERERIPRPHIFKGLKDEEKNHHKRKKLLFKKKFHETKILFCMNLLSFFFLSLMNFKKNYASMYIYFCVCINIFKYLY